MDDIYYLKKTFLLAKKALGKTKTNPMVGAVIVKDRKIIGTGYHKGFGQNHAEVEAIKSCDEAIKGATLYVNLEPCGHFGKTPPCVNEIIKSGIKEVVFATLDPNPLVGGKGKKKLEKSGIRVRFGFLEDEASNLNKFYFTGVKLKRPYVTLKIAMSLDGKIATDSGDSKWISSLKSRKYVHKLRSEYDGCLVGIKTILKDNSHLGVRLTQGRDPIRIIIDPSLDLPTKANVLRDSNLILVVDKLSLSSKKKEEYYTALTQNGVKFYFFKKQLSLRSLVKYFYQNNICSLLVEGGAQTFSSFINSSLFDNMLIFMAPKLIGGEKSLSFYQGKAINNLSQAKCFRFSKTVNLGQDILLEISRKPL